LSEIPALRWNKDRERATSAVITTPSLVVTFATFPPASGERATKYIVVAVTFGYETAHSSLSLSSDQRKGG
jgi:hypothetical protein